MNQEIIYRALEDPAGRESLCVYASYDAKSRVQKYVYHQLDRIIDELGAHVVFVTTSEELDEKDKEKLSAMGVSVIHRKNIGYDFKSYYTGFQQFEARLGQFRSIFHCNDSVYGPFASLKSVCDRMRKTGFDVWGMTDSWQINYHIQSYFVCFTEVVFEALREFWAAYDFKCDYDTVIHCGEVGMSQFMVEKGFCVGAAFPVEKHIAPYLVKVENEETNAHTCMRAMAKPRWYSITHRAMTINPSFALWKPFCRAGNPFLKKKMLIDWSNQGLHSGDWLNVIDDKYLYAKSITQASIHRDRPALVGRLKPKKYYFFVNPVKFLNYTKNWALFMRGLVSD
ncbi:rhamnan synthesis F family protein [Rubritalea marina]|uniref:rhamnan synthesis F family protein n=1 Tax=Rubritalea marina TaxID=361055 RepID=UPI0003656587|nr:rhamnan synthesis F family protein [Rubritalea marina]